MFANSKARAARRRGIVLVLILGMLGLLALIGVTFATFAGQSLINARNFSQGQGATTAEQYFDFGLGQLINDTNNPLSALRGHSLLRDMYGNDSVFRGTVSAETRGYLDHVVGSGGQAIPLRFTNVQAYANSQNKLTPALANRPQGYLQYQTNIPTAALSYQYYGLNFTRWVVKLQNVYFQNAKGNNQLGSLSQTFEVIEDDDTGTDMFSGGYHLLTLTPIDAATSVYNNPSLPDYPGQSGNPNVDKFKVNLTTPATVVPATNQTATFVLDGRYMRAFNGPGMSRPLIPVVDNTQNPPFPPLVPFNVAAYANFRVNGYLVNPANSVTSTVNFPTANNAFPGDPDLIGMDEDYDACDLENWFLAIQSADGQVVVPSFHRPSILTQEDWQYKLSDPNGVNQMKALAGIAKILRPRGIDNSPQFPPDPSTPDSSSGKITYDVDNDGDGVTDSVWLDLGYPIQRDSGGKMFKPLFAFMIIGQNGRLPLNTAGNLQDRDSQVFQTYPDNATAMALGVSQQLGVAATYYDAPTWDHASHVGASVNEVNPKYALQNAPANVYNPNVPSLGVATLGDAYFSQVDNAGVDISLTQLRALLAGTVPQDNLTSPSGAIPQEGNYVHVNNQAWYVPNGIIDSNDPITNGVVLRNGIQPVAGRWGESEGIPKFLTLQNSIFQNLYGNATPNTIPIYLNPVRAGRSFYTQVTPTASNSFEYTGDPLDDDFDSYGPAFGQAIAEYGFLYDGAGQVAVASQRARRFLVPTDPSGNGQVVDWMSRPVDVYDHGSGYDRWGRVTFFRYFRPPGVPHEVAYPMATSLASTSPYLIDAYKMPVLAPPDMPNTSNNQYHSYESFRAPTPNSSNNPYTIYDLAAIAVAGAMPFDLTQATPNASGVYPLWPNAVPSMSGSINSESGPYLMGNGPNVPVPLSPGENGPEFDNQNNQTTPPMAVVANGYPLGSLNKDEADEMNLYVSNRFDQQFGPSDLEWLYRLQDVDGSTLSSRLSQLAPVSFKNSKDGQTRRRLFSLDSWEPTSFVWANDNPNNFFPYNSRFAALGNANFAGLNQVVPVPAGVPSAISHFANPNTVEAVPNPTLEPPIVATTPPASAPPPVAAAILADPFLNPNPDVSGNNYHPHPGLTTTVPVLMTQSDPPTSLFNNALANSSSPHYPNLVNGLNAANNVTAYPVTTPALAHRDKRINLNMPLPLASDPAEPVRQKWCRETYQLLKSILPPQSVDTPQELAALSQFVVNIIDYRDPDATMTRFVNTDLMIIPATSTSPSGVKFAEVPVPSITVYPQWDPANSAGATVNQHTFTPFDPMIAYEQTNPSASWVTAMTDTSTTPNRARPYYLVQYGMEYNPIALNEVLAYTFNTTTSATVGQTTNIATPRFYIELVNTLSDDTSHFPSGASPNPTPGSGDLNLAGWDFLVTPDTDAQGRPDPITGNLPALAGLIASTAYYNSGINVAQAGAPTTVPATAAAPWTANSITPPNNAQLNTLPNAYAWSLDTASGLLNASGTPNIVSYVPALRNGGPLAAGYTASASGANPQLQIGGGYFVLASPLNGGNDKYTALQSATPDFTMPASFFPNVPAGPAPGSRYYWLHLRRPANPFNPSSEMVVVDSIRFPYTYNVTVTGTTVSAGTPPVPTDQVATGSATPTNEIFSAQRPQPYRGGHLVPNTPPGSATAQTPPIPASAWGYSEETVPATAQSYNSATMRYGSATYGLNGTGVNFAGKVFATVGAANKPADASWDFFPFHDRDFNSVAELLLVPGCPPGLFTKQFAENPFSFTTTTTAAPSTFPTMKSAVPSGSLFMPATAHPFPYLNDEFYYSAVSVAPSPDPNDGASSGPYPAQIGGWTGPGWYRMFDFFEVPSSANGAIGTAENGSNFDWARADLRPGLINLNLIVDEEVFFGLLDDQRLNTALAQYGYFVNNTSNGYFAGSYAYATLPQIISQVDYYGNVASSYFISDPNVATHTSYVPGGPLSDTLYNVNTNPTPNFVGRGFTYPDPAFSHLGPNQTTITGMKAAFADFLKLRQGGTNFLFGHQAPFTAPGTVSAVVGSLNQVWAEKPYRSLSYPDINYTVMRPATPMPALSSLSFPPPYVYQHDAMGTYGNSPIHVNTSPGSTTPVPGTTTVPTTGGTYTGDPGVRFPWLDLTFVNMTEFNPAYNHPLVDATGKTIPMVPPIPPRRLFQVPDQNATSNASATGDTTNLNGAGSLNNFFLTDPLAELIAPANNPTTGVQTNFTPQPPNVTAYNPSTIQGATPGPVYGGNYKQQDYLLTNKRQHPYYRTELLQKVMNLTTVRTHQFAVWVTVGFFEVTRAGTPELGIADILGGELGLAAGTNTRYRSFFVIDRTKATGFNPYYPGEFRDCVTYRRRIE